MCQAQPLTKKFDGFGAVTTTTLKYLSNDGSGYDWSFVVGLSVIAMLRLESVVVESSALDNRSGELE